MDPNRQSRLPVPSKLPVPRTGIPAFIPRSSLAGQVRPATEIKPSMSTELKSSKNRIALLTGTITRPKPYDLTQRKMQMANVYPNVLKPTHPAEQVAARLNFEDNPAYPATSSIMKGMTPTSAKRKENTGGKSPSVTIDWLAVNKEAEIVRLKTEIQRLESLTNAASANEEKLRVNHTKEMARLKNDEIRTQGKLADLERDVKMHETKEESLTFELDALRESYRNDTERLERKSLEFELQRNSLSSKVSDLDGQLESIKAKNNSQIMEMDMKLNSVQSELEKETKEKEFYRSRVEDLHNQIGEFDQLRSQLLEAQELISSLQREISSKEDGKLLAEVLQEELKELKNLRSENEELKKSMAIISSTEEHKNNSIQNLRDALNEAEAKLQSASSFEQKCQVLQNNITVLQNRHSQAMEELSRQITQLRHNEQHMVNENTRLVSELQSAAKSASNENITKELTITRQKINDQIAQTKRLQRRLLLVTKERDNYKKVLDSYEHEVTLQDAAAPHRERISCLESTVNDYKVLVEQLERDLKTLRGENAGLASKSGDTKVQGSSNILEEVSDPPMDMGQGDGFAQINAKPSDVKTQGQIEQYQFLVDENQRLEAKLESAANAAIPQQNELIKNAQDLEKVRQELQKAEKREKKLMEAFKNSSKEFRESVYFLTGYKIDALKQKIYRLANLYAESPNDVLLFQLENTGTVKLLDNEYSAKLDDLVDVYLKQSDSYPAFLAAHTLQLFQKQTTMSS